MSETLSNTLPEIMRQALIDVSSSNLGTKIEDWDKTEPTSKTSTNWPLGIVNQSSLAQNQISFHETVGVSNGREQITGTRAYRRGLNVRCQSFNYEWGDYKINLVNDLLLGLQNQEVTLGSNVYKIHSAVITSGPIPNGKDPKQSKLYVFTTNATISLRQTS